MTMMQAVAVSYTHLDVYKRQFLESVGDAAILEVVRSGVSGIARGEKVLGL